MTPQQRADEWLFVWRALRSMGYSSVERERLIDDAVTAIYADKVQCVVEYIREYGLPIPQGPNSQDNLTGGSGRVLNVPGNSPST